MCISHFIFMSTSKGGAKYKEVRQTKQKQRVFKKNG